MGERYDLNNPENKVGQNTNFMKMTKFKFLTIALLSVALVFTGCGGDEETVPSTLSLTTPSNQTIGSDQGSFLINFESNVDWSAVSNASWASVSPQAGTSNGQVIVAHEQNVEPTNRSASITISGEGVDPVIVSVEQTGIDNPFIGVWRLDSNGTNDDSYEQFTFAANDTYVFFQFLAASNTSITCNGFYDYSPTTSVISFTCDENPSATSYQFIDSQTLTLGDLVYFKQ
jgi:hypothetical protein